MSNTKIVVLKRKQLLYTGIIIIAGIVCILCMILFVSKKDDNDESSPFLAPQDEARYQAGIYTSVISLGDTLLNLELIVNSNQITSVQIENLDESIATMYPLIKPALNSIAEQLIAGTDPSEVTLSDDSKYTQTLLLNAINTTLKKALLEE